jgi:hypothetical protein
VSALEVAAASREAVALEDAVVAAGGCAAALRSAAGWAAHPVGRAAAAGQLVGWDEALRTCSTVGLRSSASAARPCTGLRVLDLTRVIAGPVAGRTLAALGAEVLRVDPPNLPELAERHPHLVQVHLSACGTTGPWARRRGFDSLVQVASGIGVECAGSDGAPGALPAQALDHATGHLAAAAALRGLAARALGEPVVPARLSLARTAAALLRLPRPAREVTSAMGAADPGRHRVAFGEVELIAPPGTLDGEPLGWEHAPRPLG